MSAKPFKLSLIACSAVFAVGAHADTFTVNSSSTYTNAGSSGTYSNKYFRPGKAPSYAGSAGFFDAQGSATARDIVIGANSSDWYANAKVHLGEQGDATNLQNMKQSIDIIRKANEYRARHGLNALKISDTMMAMGQIRANWSASVQYTHAPNLGDLFSLGKVGSWAGENLATDHRGEFSRNEPNIDLVTAAFYKWYDQEKVNHDTNNGGQTGHYLNIIKDVALTSGAGLATRNGQDKDRTTLIQVFGGSTSEPSFVPDEYEALLDAYIKNEGWTFYNKDQVVNVTSALNDSEVVVFGGYAIAGLNATNNTATNAGVIGTLIGGFAETGNATDNTVTITAGSVNGGGIYGGATLDSTGAITHTPKSGQKLAHGNTLNMAIAKQNRLKR